MSDLLDIVEAAYADLGDEDAWLSGILAAAAPNVGHEWGAAGWRLDADLNFLQRSTVGVPAQNDPYIQGDLLTSSDTKEQLFSRWRASSAVSSVVELLGQPTPGRDPMRLREVAYPRGARDLMMVRVDNVQDEYLGICALRREPWKSDAGKRQLWNQIAAHLGAGLRLRQRRRSEASVIVTPHGDIEHALPEAKEGATLTAIADAVSSSEKARGKMRREDPHRALDLWQGLVSGRWSLMDHFDSDGRRYILARENAPNAPGPQQLSARQRSIVRLRVRGQSLRVIAYTLGLSVGTISVELKQALRLLGVSSVLELAAIMASAADTEPKAP